MSSTAHDQTWWIFLNAMARNSDLTDAQHRVLVALLSYANGPATPPVLGSARPGVARLVQDTGYSRSTVLRALKALTVARWIIVTAPGGHQNGHGKATTYQLQVPDEPASAPTAKGATSATLEAPKGVTSGTHRVSPLPQESPTGATPPTHDQLRTSPRASLPTHHSAGMSAVGPRADREIAPTTLTPELGRALSDYGIPAIHHRAVLEVAEADPATKHATGRLHASGTYATQCLTRVKVHRAAAIDMSPRCEDHEGSPASNCSSCWADIKTGHRPMKYLGKKMPID